MYREQSNMNYDYSDIKYYNDEEFRKYLPVLAEEPTMHRILSYFKPGITAQETKEFLLSFDNIADFQGRFIIHLVEKIINDSIDDLTCDGLENVDPSKKYLFITNHRNIVLDVAGLNYVMYREFQERFRSTAIAIGDNLLTIPWVKHLARMNKSFLVERQLQPQEMLNSSKRLSQYIHDIITGGHDSVWIAHREGRTKDGNDFTQAGLIKMLAMSGEGLLSEKLGELHLLPVVISYENDPCDTMKIKELAAIQRGEKYVKGPMEDFNSMFSGLMGHKGRVHYHFGAELTREQLLKLNENIPVNQRVRNLCEYLDTFIYSNYRLYEKNYIATDILNGNSAFSHLYTRAKYDDFIAEMEEKLNTVDGDYQQNKEIFLKMFAYPVKNYYSVVDHDYTFDF